MMSPKRTKFRKAHKGRIHGLAKGNTVLNFGAFGLKALQPERITARQIESARRAITRSMKRVGRVWIRIFPDLPVSTQPEGPSPQIAADLEAVFDVPVQVSAVLGRARMDVGDLLKLGPGTVLELDRKVGEAIDIYVNNRLVARGEVVLVEEKLGVTMTEIIKAERA